MLKLFKVHNYKNFRDTLVFDFGKVGGYKFNQECICSGLVSKGIIYGRNATGKTNLGNAILDIRRVVLGGPRFLRRDYFLNADSNEKCASFYYEFLLGNSSVVFQYEKKADGELVKERLDIDQKSVYELNFTKKAFEQLELELIQADSVQIDKYMEVLLHGAIDDEEEGSDQIPFIRFLLNNVAVLPDSPIRKLEDFVSRMIGLGVAAQLRSMSLGMKTSPRFVDLCKKENLREFQEFLNIMGIDCSLISMKMPDGSPEIYFAHNKPVPFIETASSGTLSLMNLYMRFIFLNRNISFIYMDEFDAFYHYGMAEKLVKYFKIKYPNSQVILTTHNTNLMNNQLMRPDCLYILSEEGKLTALCDATERELREGHNLEKLYIGGEFENYE